MITGRIAQPGSVTVDLYTEASCQLQASFPGQGEDFLGSQMVSSVLGGTDFTLKFMPTPAGQHAISVTATASNGSTSEFSPCLNTDSKAPNLVGYGVMPASSTIPVSGSRTAAAATARASHDSAKAKANGLTGHGALVLLCPARTTRFCAGTVVIRSSDRRPVTMVRKNFKMKPGFAAQITLTLAANLFAKLKHARRVTVKACTTAHDGAKHPHHKTRKFRLRLVYAQAGG